jgi:DNA invertase Pin-like site-specific DNA recombinase
MQNVTMTRAAIYVRISRDPSGQEAGVKRQEADCRKLASDRGWDVVARFPDNDRSATSGKKRPGWEALLAAIEADQIDALVAYSSSRMYRRLADLGRLLDLLKTRPRFRIATVKSGQIDLSSADGRMLANILASVDEAEVDRMRERVSRARKQRTASGLDAGGSRPFGYEALPTGPPRVKDGKPRLQLTGEVVPEEAVLIRDAAARLLNGESIRSVLRDWDERGIRTPRGGAWRSPGLRHMLRNPRLIGVHPETGERAAWKPILDRRTHDALVELYADPTRLRSRRGGRWALTGLLFCSICGGRLTGRPSGDGRRRYVCDNVGGVHLSIAAEPLEDLVINDAYERHPDFALADVRDPQEQADLMAQIDVVDARIAQYVREGVAEGLGPRDVAAATSALRKQRTQLEAKLAEAESAASKGLHTYREAMAVVQVETRALLESTIERIEIAPAKTMGGRFNTDRVRIVSR